MRARRWATFVLGVLLLAAPAYAYLPANIEGVVKSWMNAAGQLVKLRFSPSTNNTVPTGTCDLWVDKNNNSFTAQCGAGNPTIVAALSALGCSQDASGNFICNSISSVDQNTLATPAANRFRLYDNDVNLTPDPTCVNYGVAGVLSKIDADESSNDAFVQCSGTQEIGTANYLEPFGEPGGNVGAAPAANECTCFVGLVPALMKDLDDVEVEVTTADAATTGTTDLAIYSPDGQSRYFQATVTTPFQSTGVKTVSNSITSPPAIPAGSVLVCLTVSANAAELRLRGVRDSGATANKHMRYLSTGSACNAGSAPSTLSPTLAVATADPWSIAFFDN